MPEGPEVKITTKYISETFKNNKLESVKILSGRYLQDNKFDLSFLNRNLPLTLSSVKCKGKFIYFLFKDSEINIWNTLGMTGTWSLQESLHSRVLFDFEDKKLYYNDVRNFGTFRVSKDFNSLEKKLKSIGYDMLGSEINSELFTDLIILKGKDFSLAEYLMNQKYISGVGNYIKAESLYKAKLSPWRICSSLSEEEILVLYNSIKEVIIDSYNTGGATIRDFYGVNGEIGGYSESFQVYGQAKDPLGNEVIKEETFDKRTTWWVPTIQK